MNAGLLAVLKEFDRQRPAVPGEHFIKLGLGVALLRGGWVSKVMGAALIYRAFTGKGGLAQMLNRESDSRSTPTPAGARGDGFVEVAAPWPYEERTKVATPSQTS